MSFRALTTSLLFAALLTGCSLSPANAVSARQGAINAASAQGELNAEDQTLLLDALQSIAPSFAEGMIPPGQNQVDTGKDIGPRGGLLYRSLSGSLLLRKAGYKLAQGPVGHYFSKPGEKDSIPPINAGERADLFNTLKAGDIIQCGNDKSFVHAAFYEGDGMIVHALAQAGFGKKMIGVRREKLAEYLDRVERDKFVVLRPKWTDGGLSSAIAYARAQEGKDYDVLFMTDADDRHYCTELVWTIITRFGGGRVEPHTAGKFKWRIITNEDLRASRDLTVVWRRNHE